MMPVEVDWSRNDQSLLTRFWDGAGQKDREMAAEIADRVLVYHRGFDKVRFDPDPDPDPYPSTLALTLMLQCWEGHQLPLRLEGKCHAGGRTPVAPFASACLPAWHVTRSVSAPATVIGGGKSLRCNVLASRVNLSAPAEPRARVSGNGSPSCF